VKESTRERAPKGVPTIGLTIKGKHFESSGKRRKISMIKLGNQPGGGVSRKKKVWGEAVKGAHLQAESPGEMSPLSL